MSRGTWSEHLSTCLDSADKTTRLQREAPCQEHSSQAFREAAIQRNKNPRALNPADTVSVWRHGTVSREVNKARCNQDGIKIDWWSFHFSYHLRVNLPPCGCPSAAVWPAPAAAQLDRPAVYGYGYFKKPGLAWINLSLRSFFFLWSEVLLLGNFNKTLGESKVKKGNCGDWWWLKRQFCSLPFYLH